MTIKLLSKAGRISFPLILIFTFISFNGIAQKDYPTPPSNDGLLFFIQRNLNKNTIVYHANFDKSGNLIEKNPIDVYWIRYEEGGRRMELRYIEKYFGFGVKCRKIETLENQYDVKIAADQKKYFRLVQLAPFNAVVQTFINNELSLVDHFYVQADISSFWPTVQYIEQYGEVVATGNYNYERILKN